ncbi:MAG: hypothetical protein HQ596_05935 [Candidatus Saganbacteria bacterium]|nr:hypothetical protein [Candidatus Saganbacteria bacterium]
MKIGIVAENRLGEKRVVMRPLELALIAENHEIIVERGAGMGVRIWDYEYEEIGARIGIREEAYACDVVLRIKEPSFEEIKLMRSGSIIVSMLHLRCRPKLEEALKKRRLIAIPMENLKDAFGNRRVEAVVDSGRIGMEYGFKLWGKDPATAHVKIMGYGNVAVGAIRCAARKRARVEILNRTHFTEMEKHISGTDILVDAINRPYRRDVKKEPPFVTRKMLKLLKKGSVCVDLVSNPEGHAPIETMRPTTLADPYYTVAGIYHASLWGWPGMEPETICKRYSMQLAPILKQLADKGLDHAPDFIKKAVYDLSE